MFGIKTAPKKVESPTAPAQPAYEKPRILEVLLTWKAPNRLFKRRGREYFTTAAAIAFLVIVILVVMREWLAILVVAAFYFANYVFGTVAPEEVEHQLTNRGVNSGGKSYGWEEMVRFWIEEKWGQKVLYIDTKMRFPKRLVLLLGEVESKKIEEIVVKYLPLEEPQKTWMDNASVWLQEHIPLEKAS